MGARGKSIEIARDRVCEGYAAFSCKSSCTQKPWRTGFLCRAHRFRNIKSVQVTGVHTRFGGQDTGLGIEQKVKHVAIFNDICFAFSAHFTRFF
jgi:hypothetical protein